MTCIVAIKQDTTVVMAADGLVSNSNDHKVDNHRDKIIRLDGALIGLAGSTVLCSMFDSIIRANAGVKTAIEGIRSHADAIEAMSLITAQAKTILEQFIGKDLLNTYAAIIVANRHGVWDIDSGGDIFSQDSTMCGDQVMHFRAIGQGRIAAEAFLHGTITYRASLPNLRGLARAAVITASTFYTGCGPCWSLEELTFEE